MAIDSADDSNARGGKSKSNEALPAPKPIRFVNNQGQPPSKRRRISAAYVFLHLASPPTDLLRLDACASHGQRVVLVVSC